MQVYDEYVLKGTFTLRLQTSIRHSMQEFCCSHKDVQLQKLAYEVLSVQALQSVPSELDHIVARSNENKKLGIRQTTERGKGITDIDTFNIGQPAKVHIDELRKF